MVQQLGSVWTSMNAQRKAVAILAVLAVLATMLFLSRVASQPTMALLYSGLENTAAGQVVSALEARGARYEVRGDAIFVEATDRDTLRMTLASEGMPASSGQGYELLDELSGFGTTSQMFDAAYWRAKEGELARTIVSSPLIQSARVHISNPSARPFERDSKPTAAVTVTTGAGNLTVPQAKALRYLVASAVSRLSPDDVAVIDSEGGLIAGTEDPGDAAAGDGRVAALRDRVERLLEARVGYGNAIVELSVDTVRESESIRQRTIDPESRIAISTDTEETTASSKDGGQDNVTVASNLPDGDAAADGQSSSSQNSETRERVNFEVSETEREILKIPGAVKRLTVAVLVNGVAGTNADGAQTLEPRPADELAALEELVASAVGFDAERGDVITIKSMQFDPVAAQGTLVADAAGLVSRLDVMQLAQLGVVALVALLLGLFVVRPILASSSRAPAPALAPPTSTATDAERVLTGEIDTRNGDMTDLQLVSGRDRRGSAGEARQDEGDPVDRLRQLIAERQDETIEILRNWIEIPAPTQPKKERV